MSFSLSDINARAKTDPRGFIDSCDADYAKKISTAADKITANIKNSPIVLLSGPSGSGKTTTSKKLKEELERRGIRSHAISLDNYFRSRDSYIVPKAPDGSLDFESPDCVDMDLLSEHFDMLNRGERVFLPTFDFSRQMRIMEPSNSLKLHSDEIAVFEGIHALNTRITAQHPEAFKLYISARSNVEDAGAVVFKGTWMRLVRRTVRDHLFRGADASKTLDMWANVRRGEKRYISPFKDQADLQFDSSFAYEVSVLNNMACALFDSIPEGVERYQELRQIRPACEHFVDIDPDLLRPDSLLREFVGGGIYDGE